MILEVMKTLVLKWIRREGDQTSTRVGDLEPLVNEVDGILTTPDDLLSL